MHNPGWNNCNFTCKCRTIKLVDAFLHAMVLVTSLQWRKTMIFLIGPQKMHCIRLFFFFSSFLVQNALQNKISKQSKDFNLQCDFLQISGRKHIGLHVGYYNQTGSFTISTMPRRLSRIVYGVRWRSLWPIFFCLRGWCIHAISVCIIYKCRWKKLNNWVHLIIQIANACHSTIAFPIEYQWIVPLKR